MERVRSDVLAISSIGVTWSEMVTFRVSEAARLFASLLDCRVIGARFSVTPSTVVGEGLSKGLPTSLSGLVTLSSRNLACACAMMARSRNTLSSSSSVVVSVGADVTAVGTFDAKAESALGSILAALVRV